MNKVLGWNIPNSIDIENENVGSILIHINPQTNAPAVANIGDLNKIKFGLFLKRKNQTEVEIFNGYLLDFLHILYGGTTKLDVVLEKTSIGYLLNIEFAQRVNLYQGDKLITKINLGNANGSFTSAVNADSTAILYTNPSIKPNPRNFVAVYKSYPVGAGTIDFDEQIGNHVSKILIDSHPTETFNQNSSTDGTHDAKPLNAELFSGDYHEDKTQVELLAENQMKLAYNPDSDVKNLVFIDTDSLLDNVRCKIKFDKQANNHTKVLVKSFVQA